MKKVLSLLCCLIALGVLGYVGYRYTQKQQTGPIACTLEAKQCPDGSYVGRTGPACEFAPCPDGEKDESTEDTLWRVQRDTKQGIEYLYPEQLTTTYIHTQEWPPIVSVLPSTTTTLDCKEGGSAVQIGGETKRRLVDTRTYCLTQKSEGAAGSVYIESAYATMLGDKQASVSFTLRYSQCGNYDEPSRTECETERTAFDPDSLADRIVRSIIPLNTR